MTIAIYSRGLDADQHYQLFALIEELHRHQTHILLHETLYAQYTSGMVNQEHSIAIFREYKDLNNNVDFLISLGGDGTLLESATLVRDKLIPILGINFGRLGFLASIGKEELSMAVDALVSSTYLIDKRILIHLDASLPLFNETPFGLNEFAIHKRDNSPMIKINTYLNGEYLNNYWADGLIISTPTGSTGYNMSCNGPIVFPESASFVITPVASHNLYVRPIVVPDTSIISFKVEGRTDEFICALDSRREIVAKETQITVKKENFCIKLVRLSENSFLSTLRSKLAWGLDIRE